MNISVNKKDPITFEVIVKSKSKKVIIATCETLNNALLISYLLQKTTNSINIRGAVQV